MEFRRSANGDWLSTVLVESLENGVVIDNIYATHWSDRFLSPEVAGATADGKATIFGISFYGLNPATVPDTGNTLSLFGLNIVALCGLKYEAQRRSDA